jgi:hypothetical protein|tara:strand:- start:273 stop:617 length:345 start_codon:yes stop_codon:yes gene_type:complete
MAVTYFQDTIFTTGSALTAPATGTALKVADTNLFSTTDYTLIVTVASVDTNVIVCLEGSIDGTNYAPIIANQTITANGTTVYSVANRPVRWVRTKWVSEAGGTAATVTFSVAAA